VRPAEKKGHRDPCSHRKRPGFCHITWVMNPPRTQADLALRTDRYAHACRPSWTTGEDFGEDVPFGKIRGRARALNRAHGRETRSRSCSMSSWLEACLADTAWNNTAPFFDNGTPPEPLFRLFDGLRDNFGVQRVPTFGFRNQTAPEPRTLRRRPTDSHHVGDAITRFEVHEATWIFSNQVFWPTKSAPAARGLRPPWQSLATRAGRANVLACGPDGRLGTMPRAIWFAFSGQHQAFQRFTSNIDGRDRTFVLVRWPHEQRQRLR